MYEVTPGSVWMKLCVSLGMMLYLLGWKVLSISWTIISGKLPINPPWTLVEVMASPQDNSIFCICVQIFASLPPSICFKKGVLGSKCCLVSIKRDFVCSRDHGTNEKT